MKTPLQHFSTRRLGAWQGESEFLRRSIDREPDAVQVWWWKLRLRVLGFVIARYGVDPAVRDRDHAPASREIICNRMCGERRTIEPRSRAALGAHLQSMAGTDDLLRRQALPDDDPSGLDLGIHFLHFIVLAMTLGVVYCVKSVDLASFFLWVSNSIHHWLTQQ